MRARRFFGQVRLAIVSKCYAETQAGGRWNDFEYYFAGPPPMAEAVQKMLIEKRVPYPQVHFDSFY